MSWFIDDSTTPGCSKKLAAQRPKETPGMASQMAFTKPPKYGVKRNAYLADALLLFQVDIHYLII